MSGTKPDQTPISREVRAWAIVRFVLGVLQMVASAAAILLLILTGVNSTSLSIAVLAGTFTSISLLLFGGRGLKTRDR
jgi:hypothetical protein